MSDRLPNVTKLKQIMDWEYPYEPIEGMTKEEMLFELRDFVKKLLWSSKTISGHLLNELRDQP